MWDLVLLGSVWTSGFCCGSIVRGIIRGRVRLRLKLGQNTEKCQARADHEPNDPLPFPEVESPQGMR